MRVGQGAERTDGRGLAAVADVRRRTTKVHLSAPGYLPRKLNLRFQERRRHTVRLYQRELQWPMYGANPARTQVHGGIKLRPPFRVVWSRGAGGMVEFPAVVWENVAYVNNIRGETLALSMLNGRVLWRTRVARLIASSPGLRPEARELVVTTMNPGELVVLDLRTGKVKWRYRTGMAEPSPLILNGVAYLGTTAGRVYAIDLERRKPRWVHRSGVKITSSLSFAGGRLFYGDYSGRVLALDARTGRRLWSGSAGTRVYGTVAVAGGRVFAPSVFSGISALSAKTGRLLWRVPFGVYLYSSPAVHRGRVYLGTFAGYVYSLDARTGRVIWRRPAGGRVTGAVQIVDGVVYGAARGRISAWHWRSGERLWTMPVGEYVPVSGNGRLLLMHGFSRIFAVEPAGRR